MVEDEGHEACSLWRIASFRGYQSVSTGWVTEMIKTASGLHNRRRRDRNRNKREKAVIMKPCMEAVSSLVV